MIRILFQRIGCWWRGEHDWRDGGDWFYCARCPAMQKLPEVKL